MEQWKDFLNQYVKLIIEDTDYPKKKEGILKDFSNTHLFVDTGEKIEALLLSKIIRVEIKNEK